MDELLVKTLENLDKESRENEAYKLIHENIEPFLYSAQEKILKDIAEKKKTLAGAVNAMRNVAAKRQKNGFACIEGAEGLKICREYFGLSAEQPKQQKQTATVSIFDMM